MQKTAKTPHLGASGCLDDTERGEGEINNPPATPRVLGLRFLTHVMAIVGSGAPPQKNQGLIAGLIKGKPMDNKALIRPYSWGGVGRLGGGRLTSHKSCWSGGYQGQLLMN